MQLKSGVGLFDRLLEVANRGHGSAAHRPNPQQPMQTPFAFVQRLSSFGSLAPPTLGFGRPFAVSQITPDPKLHLP